MLLDKNLIENKSRFLKRNLGNEINKFLDDEDIIEITYVQNGNLFIEKMEVGQINLGKEIISPIEAKSIIELVASYSNKIINEDNPSVSANLPSGERFQGILYDPVGTPTFSIRKKSKKIYSLLELENKGSITTRQRIYIENAILKKKNVLVIGGTSSGKTTFVNACLKVLKGSKDRIAILEDTPELKIEVDNYLQIETNDKYTMKIGLEDTMRMNVDRIIVGELRRGEESLDLLNAWNSGHEGGLSTIHANQGILSGLIKLESYIGQVTQRDQKNAILEAVNILVNVVKTKDNKRVVREIAELKGYDKEKKEYILESI